MSIPGVSIQTSAKFSSPPKSAYGAHQRVRELSIMFGVPAGYFAERGQTDGNAETELQEVKTDTQNQVARMVHTLLTNLDTPLAPDAVRVIAFEQLASGPSIAPATPNSPMRSWLQGNSKWILLGVVLFVCLLLASDIGRIAWGRRPAESQLPSPPPEKQADGETAAANIIPLASQDNDESEVESAYVHDTLTDVVREDPQAAAAMLRNWVEKAG